MKEHDQTLHQLSSDTARLISSTQIVTSVSSVVKELLENALDAGSNNILVKLENFGLDLIEVKDDGTGIAGENVQKMFLPGFTSKLSNFKDLDYLTTYGFRGEALSAVCKLGETSITTKTERDAVAMTYIINKDGMPTSSLPSHLPKGTIIAVKNLFKTLPVRKQYSSSKKKMADELKKVENTVHSLAVIHPKLRIVLFHNKSIIWQKNGVNSLKQSLMQVVGLRHASKMDYLAETQESIKLEIIVPRKDLSNADTLFTSSPSMSFLFINSRPVCNKEISKVIEEMVNMHWKITDKHALFLASLTIPPKEVDVNLEPNKTKVLLRNLPDIIALIISALQQYYSLCNIPQLVEIDKEHAIESDEEKPSKRQKLDDSFQIEEKKYDKSKFVVDQVEASSICSQINKGNCVLASEKEVSELHLRLGRNGRTMTNNPSMEIMRDDIQENIAEKILDRPGLSDLQGLNGLQNKTTEGCHKMYVEQCKEIITCESPVSEENFNQAQEVPSVQPDPKGHQSSKQLFFDKACSSSTMENCNEGSELILLKDWSRGQVTLKGGKSLEGGAALITAHNDQQKNKCKIVVNEEIKQACLVSNPVIPLRTHRESEVSHTVDVTTEIDVSQFNLSIDSACSQMGKKEYSGFTKFARIVRPKIIAETPNIQFTEVSRLLVERWKALTVDEKEYYENVAKAVDEERKNHKQQKTLNETRKPEKPNKPMKAVNKPNRPERRQVLVPMSLEKLQQLYISRRTAINAKINTGVKLIGQLPLDGHWLYHSNKEIGHIRHTGLNEVVLYHKMMSNYAIATKKLDEVLHITETVLKQPLWDVLTSLDTEYNSVTGRHVVTCPAVIKNGFMIEFMKSDSDVVMSAFITGVAADFPECGINHLKEALDLYNQQGEFAALHDVRTTAVKTHIEDKVKQLCSNKLAPGRGEMASLLCTWQQSLSHFPPNCFHGREIFVPIYALPSS